MNKKQNKIKLGLLMSCMVVGSACANLGDKSMLGHPASNDTASSSKLKTPAALGKAMNAIKEYIRVSSLTNDELKMQYKDFNNMLSQSKDDNIREKFLKEAHKQDMKSMHKEISNDISTNLSKAIVNDLHFVKDKTENVVKSAKDNAGNALDVVIKFRNEHKNKHINKYVHIGLQRMSLLLNIITIFNIGVNPILLSVIISAVLSNKIDNMSSEGNNITSNFKTMYNNRSLTVQRAVILFPVIFTGLLTSPMFTFLSISLKLLISFLKPDVEEDNIESTTKDDDDDIEPITNSDSNVSNDNNDDDNDEKDDNDDNDDNDDK